MHLSIQKLFLWAGLSAGRLVLMQRGRGGVGSIAGHVRIPSCLQGRVLVSCKQALPPVKDEPRLELGYKDSRVL